MHSVFRSPSRASRQCLAAGLAAILSAAFIPTSAPAQNAENGPIFKPGSVAVTGFAGTTFPADGIKPGIDPVDETFIDPDGPVLRVFDLGYVGEAPKGQVLNTSKPFTVNSGKVGQVFGLAYDDGKRNDTAERVPNLYVTATTLHGLQIVGDDADSDGRPERLKSGQAGARFMTGQFGLEIGGGPGAIYKIDGKTGEVSLFANVALKGTENSGPGLGNIAFDAVSRQLFVSDLDTGMIHRFDLSGTDLGTFDHGAVGRPKRDLEPVAHDAAKRMDITSESFDPADPETWGLADPRRRIYGVAVKGGRLFYSVFYQQQIWSIGIKTDGSFADDARWELNAAAAPANPITDIVFDKRGLMYLAQRGATKNVFDYSVFAQSGETDVMRYRPEAPDDPETDSRWVPEPDAYAVGFPSTHKMGVGGIDLGYGYDDSGQINRGQCDDTVFKTGDNLRDNAELTEKLIETGAAHVHGLQITHRRLTRPENEPPFQSYFVNFDGLNNDPDVRGHVGDVEVWRPCLQDGAAVYGPGDIIPPIDAGGPPRRPREACLKVEDIRFVCGPGGVVSAEMILINDKIPGADSLQAKSLTPGISLSPQRQTVPVDGFPYTFSLAGALPGERTFVDFCSFKKSDADAGGTFPCCKARIPITLPTAVCEP
ncbi:MAG: hypothetical protein AAF732_07000 [Pseudomonadota bacterium]